MARNLRKRLVISEFGSESDIRPLVCRLAQELHLEGWVRCEWRQVIIEVQGAQQAINSLLLRLQDEIECTGAGTLQWDIPLQEESGIFRMLQNGNASAELVDVGICADCVAELHDPANRRHNYPFISCNQCGPRYALMRRISASRMDTAMSGFTMCGECRKEYTNPASRRFGQETISCSRCGPKLRLIDGGGADISTSNALGEAARLLASGRIVAIKATGGYYLACRADDDYAVRRLRRRKRRDFKPFTVMVRDMAAARRICNFTSEEAAACQSRYRPIVIMATTQTMPRLPILGGSMNQRSLYSHIVLSRPAGRCVRLATPVAESLAAIGVMLPASPLHVLLFDSLAEVKSGSTAAWPPPLVITPGNYSDEPLATDDESALVILGPIADAVLTHDLPIERPMEPAVVTVLKNQHPSIIRGGLGTTPAMLEIPWLAPEHPIVLAVGAEADNALCLLHNKNAILGEHIGDLRDGRTYRHFISTVRRTEDFFEQIPRIVAADLDGDYLSTEYAMRRWRGEVVGRSGASLVRVQHHHAHAVSCLADNADAGPAVAIVCDNGGKGDDGHQWGAEILRVDSCGFERLGHLRYTTLPGGMAAMREIWRSAVGILHESFGPPCIDHIRARPLKIAATSLTGAMEMLELGSHCMMSSALGRLFDAAAWLCGLAVANTYPDEAMLKLQAIAADGVRDVYSYSISNERPFVMDPRPMMEAIVGDLASAVSPSHVAAKFHNTVARFLAEAAIKACHSTGINTVVISGGSFTNVYLAWKLTQELREQNLNVLLHKVVPCGDGGVAVGQAVVAASRAGR